MALVYPRVCAHQLTVTPLVHAASRGEVAMAEYLMGYGNSLNEEANVRVSALRCILLSAELEEFGIFIFGALYLWGCYCRLGSMMRWTERRGRTEGSRTCRSRG